MEKEEHRQEIAPRSFPNLQLLVPYNEALYYVQGRLGMFGRGELKPFCEAGGFSYTAVINLKNGKLKREEPHLLQRVLRHLAVPTELIRYPLDTLSNGFILSDTAALAAFQEQIAFFKSCQ